MADPQAGVVAAHFGGLDLGCRSSCSASHPSMKAWSTVGRGVTGTRAYGSGATAMNDAPNMVVPVAT
jgi:hypothetical protein